MLSNTSTIGFRVLRAVAIVSLPLTLFSCLMVLNMANPMALAFLITFAVDNQSGEAVWVTPVGAIGHEGRRSTLPISASSFLSIPALTTTQLPISSGEQFKVTYDWDDIQFSELLIVPAAGPTRMLVVDEAPTERQYRPAKTNYFLIPKLSELPEARPDVLAVLNRNHPRRPTTFWLIMLSGLIPPLVIWHSGRRLKSLATPTNPS